jgi:type VI secretion system secreted protein Hcp
MGRRRAEAERDRRRAEGDRPAADADPERERPVQDVLALQRTAGNRAVSALLARSPERAVPADAKGAEAAGPRATLTGIGTIPLLSVSLGLGRGGAPGGGNAKPEPTSEIALTSRLGPHSQRLSKAAVDGRPMDVEIVVPRGKSALRVTIKNALVHGYSVSSGEDRATESWTLTFSGMTFEVQGEGEAGKAGDQGAGGSWDLTPARGA